MIAVPYIGFALVALAAIGFGTFALWRPEGRSQNPRPQPGSADGEGPQVSGRPRGPKKARALLASAIALFLLGVGGGSYWMLGQPGMALRAAQGLKTRDVRALIPLLIARVRQSPGDQQAWAYLGRAYISSGDVDDASKAYARAVTLARLAHRPDANLEATYGMTLVATGNGVVGDEAQAAFRNALTLDPKNIAARLYLGQARASRGDAQGALALWQGLLADVPTDSPLHQELIDRIAMLTSQNLAPGGGAPDPMAMVAGLAARLKDNPDDAAGWQRLIRAYTVLGETDKAKTALATARKTFAAQREVLAALAAEAVALKLE